MADAESTNKAKGRDNLTPLELIKVTGRNSPAGDYFTARPVQFMDEPIPTSAMEPSVAHSDSPGRAVSPDEDTSPVAVSDAASTAGTPHDEEEQETAGCWPFKLNRRGADGNQESNAQLVQNDEGQAQPEPERRWYRSIAQRFKSLCG